MAHGDDAPYEDDDFIEKYKLPAASQDGVHEYFWFIFQHKHGHQNVFQALAKDRTELADKIAAGDYTDADHRNVHDEEDEGE